MAYDVVSFFSFVGLVAWKATTMKSMIVSFATAYFYYCLTHLDDEVEYIWKRKWDLGKVIYLITRYSGVSFFVFLCLTEISLGWNFANIAPSGFGKLIDSEPSYTYLLSVTFTLIGGFIMIMAEIILQIRVYAIYGRKKWMLSIFVLMNMVSLSICALQTSGYLDVIINRKCINYLYYCTEAAFTFIRREDVFTDATSMSWIPIVHPMSALSWLIVSVFELLLFILVIRKAKYQFWYKRRPKEVPITRDVMEVMAKDSTNYFIILFSVSAIGTIIFFVEEVDDSKYPLPWVDTQNILHNFLNVYQAMAIAVMTILAPRMLINIRSEVCNPGNLPSHVGTLPWDGSPALESFCSSEISELR